jgi:hypothetical protein
VLVAEYTLVPVPIVAVSVWPLDGSAQILSKTASSAGSSFRLRAPAGEGYCVVSVFIRVFIVKNDSGGKL